MKVKLTYSASNRYWAYYLNDIKILSHTRPYNLEQSFVSTLNRDTRITDVYLLNNRIYQTRVKTTRMLIYDRESTEWVQKITKKERKVSFPVKQALLKQFNIPKNLIIYGELSRTT